MFKPKNKLSIRSANFKSQKLEQHLRSHTKTLLSKTKKN